MSNLVFRTINNVASFLKGLRLERLFVAALAGFLLLVNTACSSTPSRTSERVSDAVRSADTRGYDASSSPYKGQAKQQRELYAPVQPRKGGMNEYSDDFKQDTDSAKARAEELINRSKQNLQKRADSPQQFVKNYQDGTPLGERVRNLSDDAVQSAKETGKIFSEGAKEGSRNMKENAAQFRTGAPKVVEQAGRNFQGATQDFREGAGNLSRGVQSAADRAADSVQGRS